MLEYFVNDSINLTQFLSIILAAATVGLTCLLVSDIKDLKEQRKNGKRLDTETVAACVIFTVGIATLLFLIGMGVSNNRKLEYTAKHDAIARHYKLKRDGNHLLLTLKDPDKDYDFEDNILLDLSSETKDSYHVIFHDDLYNIPKSDKKQATRIENTKE